MKPLHFSSLGDDLHNLGRQCSTYLLGAAAFDEGILDLGVGRILIQTFKGIKLHFDISLHEEE